MADLELLATETTESNSNQRRNSNGKRFVRRARRWAELQQRRSIKKNFEDVPTGQNLNSASLNRPTDVLEQQQQPQHHQQHHQHHHQQQQWKVPNPPNVYDYVEFATMGSGVVVLDDDLNYSLMSAAECQQQNQQKPHLGPRRSFPCTVLHPRRQQMQMPNFSTTSNNPNPNMNNVTYHHYPHNPSHVPHQQHQQHHQHNHQQRRHQPCHRTASDAPVYYTEGINEYGNTTYISVYQTSPEITVFPQQRRHNNVYRCSPTSTNSSQLSLPSSPEVGFSAMSGVDDAALSLITNDLSATTISDSSNYSPNSSTNSEEEIYSGIKQNYRMKGGNLGAKLFISKPLYIPPDFLVNTVPPPERSWVMIRHADPERPIATFTVLCYNVLCDKYATVNQYSYCPSWALNWEYRKTLILKEIRTYEADIITLQEVETEQFRTLFQPELKTLGYVGIFTPKSRAKTMSEEERKYVDGCAIFWKTEKFELDRQHPIEFTALAMKKASNSENMLNRVMPRDNVALCAVLKIKESVYANLLGRVSIPMNDNVVGNPLVVCTAHIHWDPEFCDVKLVQTMMLAHEVCRLLEEVSKKFNINNQQCPVLICGDLNSLPDSGVYEYLSRGHITRRHMDLKSFREDPCLEKFTTSTDKNLLSHPLRLDSAMELSSAPFTNYTLDFKGMIDYIFSTPQSLARLGVLGPFDTNWVNNNKILGFPHPHVPSDHIPIMAQYAIIPTSHQRQPPPPQSHTMSHGVIGGGLPSHSSYR